MSGIIQPEIQPSKPFTSPEQAAFITTLRTAEYLQARNADFLKRYELSPTQYNVLRILRGAGKAGLPCSDVGDRMINRDPDITRLLDRLEKRGLVKRNRSEHDRRVILARITNAGLALLRKLDRPVEKFLEKLLAHLDRKQLLDLVDLLDRARNTPSSN